MTAQTFNFSSTIPPDSTISCGDIHGMGNLYHDFLEWVRNSNARVILLGDLVDRGPHDLYVLERTRDLIQDPESWGLASFTCVQGNHEHMLLNALAGYGWSDWVRNGGNWEKVEEFRKHVDWLSELPYYVVIGDTLFSHTGCFRGEDPAKSMDTFSKRELFVWQRGGFLKDGPMFEVWTDKLKKVVFGHTPEGPLPYRIPNGICIDTGAFSTGVLTAYNSTYDTFMQFTTEEQEV